jgi:hypothetical protein
VRLSLLAAVAGAFLAAVPAAPAWAHDQVPAASDYQTTLVAVTPKTRGLDVRVVENGSRIEVRNGTGRDVTVLGYSGEPYLRITPDAVFTNVNSPTGYVNEKKPTPAGAGATATPEWRRTGADPVARWHDHRSHWTSAGLPPAAAADPQAQHRIRDWTVPLLTGTDPVRVAGTLDYAPPPATAVWWAGILVGIGAVLLLGRLAGPAPDALAGPAHAPLAGPALGALLGTAALAELADSVGRALDSGRTGFGIVAALLTTETYGTAAALGAVAAAVVAVQRKPVAPLALALAGACLAVLGGVTDAAVFNQAFAPVPWSADLARACTAVTIAVGMGVTAAAWLRIRTDRPAPATV